MKIHILNLKILMIWGGFDLHKYHLKSLAYLRAA